MGTTKSIFISGATSGLGKYLAHYFINKGWFIIAHGRSSQKIEELKADLNNNNVRYFVCDMNNENEIVRMFNSISEAQINIDALINCAFGKLEKPIYETTYEESKEFYLTSLVGTVEIIKNALPFLRKSESSNIINIVADWGIPMHNIMTGTSQYISGKYGIHGLGVALQTELAEFGVKTTNIFPGIIASSFKFNSTDKDFEMENGNSAIHPKDIAQAIEFVLNQQFSHIRQITLTPPNPQYNGL